MKITTFYIIVVLAWMMISCSSLLEEEVYSSFSDKEYYQTEQQIVLATNGVYEVLRTIANSNQYLGNIGTDEARMWKGDSKVRPIETYEYDAYTDLLVTTWSALYKGINRANAVIAGVNRSPLASASKERYIAEMRFLRGFYYYWLVRLYGEVPIRLEQSTSFENSFAQKSSVEDVYTVIIEDFKAAEILPESYSTGVGRATKGAAKAYLASVYLSMTGFPLYKNSREDYQKVIDKAQEVIDLADAGVYRLLPNYEDVFATENTQESIFECQAGSVAGTGCNVKTLMGVVGVFPVVYHQDDPAKHYPDLRVGKANIRPVWSFVDSYYDDGEKVDKRKTFSIADYTLQGYDKNGKAVKKGDPKDIVSVEPLPLGSDRTDESISKYRFPDGWDVKLFKAEDNPLNWVFMRYAEVLLIMAEAQYHVNGADATLPYLEQLSDRAGVDTWDGSGDFTERILKERSWELCFEGKRWFDLQRLDKIAEYVNRRDDGYAPNYDEFMKATVKASQKYYPVPQIELDYNTEF